MSKSLQATTSGAVPIVPAPWRAQSTDTWWGQHREASLNWLALGLLLAAWNASDNDSATQTRRQPEALRGYSFVSVRAATIHPWTDAQRMGPHP